MMETAAGLPPRSNGVLPLLSFLQRCGFRSHLPSDFHTTRIITTSRDLHPPSFPTTSGAGPPPSTQVLESFSLALSDPLSPGQRLRSATFTVAPERIAAADAQVRGHPRLGF